MKATDLLKQQHRQLKALMRKCQSADDASERRALVDELVSSLQMHIRIEEAVFYPAVRGTGTKKAEEIIDESVEEHHVVSLLLEELPGFDVENERFGAKISVLSEIVSDHIEEEEETTFKIALKLGDARLKELGMQMEQMSGKREVEGEVRATGH